VVTQHNIGRMTAFGHEANIERINALDASLAVAATAIVLGEGE